jgi:lipoprotein-releasing system ATP-binding protein
MNDPVFQVALKGVEKTYSLPGRRISVLKNVTLEIPPGDYTAVVGPSGAGKSTLLYLMGLLSVPDRGDVLFDGNPVRGLGDRKRARLRARSIGFIFQSYHLMPEFTALENVFLPAQVAGFSKTVARDRARALLDRVDMRARESHYPFELSGGEQQRVCLCRALINRPRLILADEPTGNLDSANAARVIALLEELCRESGATLVIVTHNEELASRTRRRIELADGEIAPGR